MPADPARPGAHRYPSVTDPASRANQAAYWRANVRLLAGLLVVWFVISFGFGILLAEPLNAVRFPGTGVPLGFWFAQQGSIYGFVILIFVYVAAMNRLDRRFDLDEEDDP